IRGGNRILDVEQCSRFAAHPLAILDSDPLGAIDEEAQHRVAAPGGILELDELVPQPPEQRLYEDDEPLSQGRRHRISPSPTPPQTKMGREAQKNKSPSGGFLVKHFRRARGLRRLALLSLPPTTGRPLGRGSKGRAF